MGKHLDVVPFSGIIRIRDMMYSVEDPFRLDQGDVSFDAPDTVKAAMRRAIDENQQPLPADDRRARLLELLADEAAPRERHSRRQPRRGDGDDRRHSRAVHRLPGAARARRRSDPAGPGVAAVRRQHPGRAGACRCGCPLHETLGWRFDLDELESRITPTTRAIYINSPHNPTGGVLTRADLERIAAIVARAQPLADLRRGLRGRRLRRRRARQPGVAAGHVRADDFRLHLQQVVRDDRPAARLRRDARMRQLRERMKKVLFYTCSNVTSVVQFGGIGALEGSQDSVAAFRDELQARRDLFYDGHPHARRRAAHRRAAARRVLRVPADRSGMGPHEPRRVAVVGDGRAADLAGTHRLRARRGLRRARRGLHPVLLRARSA